MVVVLLVREGVAHAQFVEDGVVGVAASVLFEDGLAEHLGGHLLVGGEVGGVGETAGVVHGRVDGQALGAAEVVVVRAVTRRDVDEAGAGVGGDEVGGEEPARARAEGVFVGERGEFVGGDGALDLVAAPPGAFLRDGFEERVADEIDISVGVDARVEERRVEGDGEVRGERPGRGGPDEEEGVRLARELELHIDRLADVVGVFHLGLGERGAARDAPIHRLLATIDEALRDKVGEEAQLIGLVFLVEREVGVLPVAEDAEAFELGALEVDVFAGVGIAGGADGSGVARGVAGLAHVLRDLELDGQAVAVPAGDVGGVEAAE